ncbi:NlpC/P60 family protein, partial [Bacteroidota bacterium]
DKSEMITQLLFGETYKILESNNKWSYIRSDIDRYEGWIDSKNISLLNSEEIDNKYITRNLINYCIDNSNSVIHLMPGSFIPNYDYSTQSFSINYNQYSIKKENLKLLSKDIRDQFITAAKLFINSPYLWGGKTPFGTDCSGFTQIVYRVNGILIPRDAEKQSKIGETVNFFQEIRPGDLLFFDNEEGEIIHVGIYLGNHKIIHASGKVRIDNVDQQGIFNKETQKYTHHLRIVKTI